MFESIYTNNVYKNLYNGEYNLLTSDKTIDVYSPVDKVVIGKIQALDKESIDKILKNSHNAQKAWSMVPINERSKILHKAANLLEENEPLLTDLLIKEIAKDKASAQSEVKRTADFIRYTADEGKCLDGEIVYSENFPGFNKNKISLINRIPLGVVLAISPFNYPINLSASKIAPALMGGNSVVLKPPTQGAISALYLAEIFNAAGIPKGVLNTITGNSSEIGDYLVTHKHIDFINFTGSTKVGKHIAKIAGMIPMLLELGGKDSAIVLSDADLSEAAEAIVSGAYSYSGQRCTAIKRVLVMDESADELVEKLKNNVLKLKVGKPEEDVQITPLINVEAADYVQELINDAEEKGARLIVGNKRTENLVYPTLFDYVTKDMRLAWEEPFGPVLPVMRVKNTEEAVEISNSSQYGLQASVFTKNIDSAFNIAGKLEVGTVNINNKTERGPDNFPFLGVKASGMGTQGIRYSIEAMTRPKVTVINIKQ